MIYLYNILFLIANVVALPISLVKAFSVEKRRATVVSRLSPVSQVPPFRGRPIWIHMLSVGEVLSALTLIKRIKKKYSEYVLVCSVSTHSGYRIACEHLSKEADLIFFFPYDFLWAVRPLIRRVDPRIFLLVETDMWPNLLREVGRHGVPAVLVNGRISPQSFMRHKRFRFFSKLLFSGFSFCCMQTEADARRIMSLGVAGEKVEITGNIKFDQPLLNIGDEDVDRMKSALKVGAKARILLAGSTHEGEEEILLRCFTGLRKDFSDLVLIVVPRDPARAGAVRHIFTRAGVSSILKTELYRTDVPSGPEAIIVDTMGELRKLYAVADVVYIGKSLVKLGGQNPLEPAAFKKPVAFGPHMFNFELIAEMLVAEGGAVQVADENALTEQVRGLLLDADRRRVMGMKAYEVFCGNQGAVDKVLRIVDGFLGDAKAGPPQ